MGEGVTGTRDRRCDACGSSVDPGDKYCPECGSATGAATDLRCPACGEPHPERAGFCSQCGAHLGSIARAERRVITVLFADLSGFTRLTEQLDPEVVHRMVSSCLEPLTRCVTRWGGYVDKFIGDCVMALFGAPAAYENEPERAVRAALDMQEALQDWTEGDDLPLGLAGVDRPSLRIGVNTGSVVTGIFSGGGARDYTAVGDVVNVASRLQSLCDPGEVLVGERTYAQARHVCVFGDEEVLTVKGRDEPVRARRVLGLRGERRSMRGFQGRTAPLVNRRDELRRLREAWAAACEGEPHPLLLVGAPGIGKSRLVEELMSVEDLEPSRVARGRSYPYATRTPWEPISELLQSLYALPSRLEPSRAAAALARRSDLDWGTGEIAALSIALGREAEEVTGLAGQSPSERRETVSSACIRALSFPPESEPRLLVLEDLQWADGTTLEFLSGLRGSQLSGPLLMVLVTRPPLPDETRLERLLESPLGQMQIGALEPGESEELLEALLGEHELPGSLLRRVVDRAEGNPLFLEEILKSMAERDEIRRDDGRWRVTGNAEHLEVPDGVESLLTTRMDALPASTKRVLQYAAVVGRRFWRGVLADELADRPVDEDLERLREAGLVRPVADSRIPGDREFAFEHLLLQEVAYDSVLQGARQRLHRSVATWLERQPGGEGPENHDLVAHHWERSDEPIRAVPHLEAAGRRARARGALRDARTMVDRALEVSDDPGTRLRLLGLAEDLAADLGDPERRAELIGSLEELGPGIQDAAPEAEAAYRRARLRVAQGRLEEAREDARRALDLFRRTQDASREGDTLSLLGRIAHLWGEYGEARRCYDESLDLQRRSGDRHGEAEILDRKGLVQIDLGRFEEALETLDRARSLCAEIGAPAFEARCAAHRATALRSLGCLSDAETACREALEVARRSGSRRARASAELTLGMILGDLGRLEEATVLLDRTAAFARETSRPALAARTQLARAQVADGEEGLRRAEDARESAAESGLVHVEILALDRQATIYLEAGELDRADRLSERAAGMLAEHGNLQGPEERIHATRARVLQRLGREEDAASARESARSVILEKAERIGDDGRRERFLDRAPLDVSAVERGRRE